MSSSLLRQGHRIVTIKHVSPNIQWTQKISPLFRLYSNVGLKEEVSSPNFYTKLKTAANHIFQKESQSEWDQKLTEGKKLVGFHEKDSNVDSQNVMNVAKKLLGKDLTLLTNNISKIIDTNHPVLNTASNYYFSQGGKHFRPLIVLLIAQATNSLTPQASNTILFSQRKLGEITEMIHTASLLHDDVIDVADKRRNMSSANIAFGNKVAVLSGDYLLAKASIALAQLRNLQVVELLATVIANLVEGEMMQMKVDANSLFNFDYYIEKTFLKTGSLIAKSCQASAILGGQSEHICNLAYQYGRNLGLAFQLVDDVLDFTGTAEELGKPIAADLELGLVTAPVLFAAKENRELIPLIQRQFQEKGDPQRAREIVLKTNGVQRTTEMALEYSLQARNALSELPPSQAKDCLIALSHLVVSRKN